MSKILATRYSSEKLAGKTFDTIVIGSGIGGLTAACLLAKRGQKVAVLERHYMAGGLTHYFKRKEFEWDVGLHYIGDVDSERSISRQLFNYITDGELKWNKISDPYDQAVFPDQVYDFIGGEKNFLEQMLVYFPKEKKALTSYLTLVREAVRSSKAYYGMKTLPPMLGKPLGYFFDHKFHKHSDPTVWDVLSRLTTNKRLIAVLTTQWGDYGLPPHQASFMIHAMVVKHYLKGACFPCGGSKAIARSIIKTLRKNDADVYVRAEVERIIVNNGKCLGVRMKNQDEIYAKNVVSSAGVFNTYKSFLQQGDLGRHQKKVDQSFTSINRSASHVSLYLGLNKTAKELELTPGNQWIFPSYDHKKNIETFLAGETKSFPVTYVSFPSAKDPLWEEEHPGISTIDVIAFMPYKKFMKWENTSWYKRGEEYQDFKEEITAALLKTTINQNPKIKDHIVVKELSTPLSTRHFANYKEGEIYGLDHTPKRFREPLLRPHTPIKNLYLTGQDIVSAGICGGLNAGLLTSMALMKKNLQKDVAQFSQAN